MSAYFTWGRGLGSWGLCNLDAIIPLPPGPSFCAATLLLLTGHSPPFKHPGTGCPGQEPSPTCAPGRGPTPQGPSCRLSVSSCGVWLLRARPLSHPLSCGLRTKAVYSVPEKGELRPPWAQHCLGYEMRGSQGRGYASASYEDTLVPGVERKGMEKTGRQRK